MGATMGTMSQGLFEVECPCCNTVLKIDPETRAVIAHAVPEKPPAIEDLAAAVAKLKGQAGWRDEVFRKQFEAEKIAQQGARKEIRRVAETGQGESGSD